MKPLAVALVLFICISVAVVDGRKNKRGRKEHLQRLEARREFQRTKMRKQNVVEPNNDAAANKPEDAKPQPVISNDAKAQPAKEEKRGHKALHKKREFKHNHAIHDLHRKEDFHKRHHGKKWGMHPNDVRKRKMMSREKLLGKDLPEAKLKRMMKLMKKRAKHDPRNHSRDHKRRLKANAP